MLAIETLPLALPGEVGANFTVNEVLEFALMVCGALSPLMLKPVPVTLTAEMVTLAVPEFVSVTEVDALAPVKMLSKVMFAGSAESWACVPVPLKPIVRLGSEASLETVILPEAPPDTVGLNAALKLVL